MRDFKIWDKTTKVFSNPYDYAIRMDGTIIYNWDHDEWTEAIDIDPEILQYTGLKDKHGNKIYEGDIVQIEYRSQVIDGIVQWDILNCAYLVDNCGICGPEQSVRVLGNIFENPELIN